MSIPTERAEVLHLKVEPDEAARQPEAPLKTSESEPAPLVLKMPVDIRSLALLVIAILAVIFVLRYAQEVVIPVVLGILIGYALDPVVTWLRKWWIPRWIGALLVLACVAGGIGGTVYSLSDEALALIGDLPRAARKLREDLRATRRDNGGALQKVQQAAAEIEKTAAVAGLPTSAPQGVTKVQIEEPSFKAADYLWWGSMGIVAVATQLAMMFFLVFFLLLSGDLYKRKLVKIAGPTFSSKKITVQILDEITRQIERFLATLLLTGLIVAVATWAALRALGLAQPAIWGIMAGLLNSIPYFGPVIITAGLSMVAYLQFGNIPMTAYVAGAALLITTLEGSLITPALMGRAGRMSPVAVFIGLLFWSWMWGVWGLILAVPMMMVIKAICDHIEDVRWIGELLGD